MHENNCFCGDRKKRNLAVSIRLGEGLPEQKHAVHRSSGKRRLMSNHNSHCLREAISTHTNNNTTTTRQLVKSPRAQDQGSIGLKQLQTGPQSLPSPTPVRRKTASGALERRLCWTDPLHKGRGGFQCALSTSRIPPPDTIKTDLSSYTGFK